MRVYLGAVNMKEKLKNRLFTLTQHDKAMSKQFWEDRFGDDEYVYGTEPNVYFRDFIEGRSSGRLLLPAEGEGRNAVFAAKLGWEVDAFDFSTNARKKAFKLADQNNVKINYFNSDINELSLKEGYYDVIALLYAHQPSETRRKAHLQLLDYLKPNGIVVLEAFSKMQLGNNSGGPKDLDMLYDVQDLKKDFRAMTIETIEEKKIIIDQGKYHQGSAHIIRLLGVKAESCDDKDDESLC